MSNYKDENDLELESEKKSLKEKYLEQTVLNIPVHEIIRLIVLVIACQNLGSITSNKYTAIQHTVNNNQILQILMIFLFCYINTNFKLEASLFATACLIIVYMLFKYINKKKVS
jgi:hypothetical protein